MSIELSSSGDIVNYFPNGVITVTRNANSKELTVEYFLNILASLINKPNNRNLPEVIEFINDVKQLKLTTGYNDGASRLSVDEGVFWNQDYPGDQTVTDYLLNFDRIRPLHEFLTVGWYVLTISDLNVVDCRPSFIEYVRNM